MREREREKEIERESLKGVGTKNKEWHREYCELLLYIVRGCNKKWELKISVACDTVIIYWNNFVFE